MIFGIGSDIVEIKRIEELLNKFGSKFIERIFTKNEQEKALKLSTPVSHLAKRFAAKEAFVKALGTCIDQGISWKDIEVINLASGKPELVLYGKARQLLEKKAPDPALVAVHLSLSDSKQYALAVVVIEIREKNQ